MCVLAIMPFIVSVFDFFPRKKMQHDDDVISSNRTDDEDKKGAMHGLRSAKEDSAKVQVQEADDMKKAAPLKREVLHT